MATKKPQEPQEPPKAKRQGAYTSARKDVDWDAIERHYRAGQLTVAELSRRFAVSRPAIEKRAERLGWVRQCAAAVVRTVGVGEGDAALEWVELDPSSIHGRLAAWDLLREAVLDDVQDERALVRRTVAMAALFGGDCLSPVVGLGDSITTWARLRRLGKRGEVDALVRHPDEALSVIEFKDRDSEQIRDGIGQALVYTARLRAAGRTVRHTALAWVPLRNDETQAELECACTFAGVVPLRCHTRQFCAAVGLEAGRKNMSNIAREHHAATLQS